MAHDGDTLPSWLRASIPSGEEAATPLLTPSVTSRFASPAPASPESPFYLSMAQASSASAPVPAAASVHNTDSVGASPGVVATVDVTATIASAAGSRANVGVPLRSIPVPSSVSLPSAAQHVPVAAPHARYEDPSAFRFLPRAMPTWSELSRVQFFPRRFQWARIADVNRYVVLPGHKNAQAVWDARHQAALCDLAVPANLPCDAYFLEDAADERLVRHLARLRTMRRDELAHLDPWAAAPSAGFLLDGGVGLVPYCAASGRGRDNSRRLEWAPGRVV